MEALVYVCDEFSPVDVDAPSLFALAEEDPLRLFDEYVRPFVEDCVGEVLGVEASLFFDPSVGLVVEYIARHGRGSISAKLIYSPNPEEALAAYYARRQP